MNKGKLILVLIIIALVALVSFSGCVVSQSETDKGIFGTEKTTTSVGTEGIKTSTKTCPFWDPNC